MEATNLATSIEKYKEHGDAVKIAKLVNELRKKDGMKTISPATVRSMLNGNRTPSDDVTSLALKFYEAQKQAQQFLNDIAL